MNTEPNTKHAARATQVKRQEIKQKDGYKYRTEHKPYICIWR